jgi:hypothetical protein
VRTGEDAQRDDVDVFLNSGVDYHLGRLVKTRIDDLHARIPEGARDYLRAAVVAVKPGRLYQ